MTLEQLVREIRQLSIEQRKTLITLIVDSLTEPETVGKTRSILESEGLGAEVWVGVDAQEYVNHLRGEWESRP